VTFAADFLRLDLLALPWRSGRLGAGLYRGLGNNAKPLLLLAPGAGNSVEPHVRYAVGLELTLADGMVVKDLGQLVVTSDRIIGMVTYGSAGPATLDAAAGAVYAFSARLDGLQCSEIIKKRRGVPGGMFIRPGNGRPPEFELQVKSVLGSLDDDGRLTFGASLADLMTALAPGPRSLANLYTGSMERGLTQDQAAVQPSVLLAAACSPAMRPNTIASVRPPPCSIRCPQTRLTAPAA
jgi:hypothetical protein